MLQKINDLKNQLSEFTTSEILGYISTKFITFANDKYEVAENSNIFNKTDLDSPYKQYVYLAGLLMSTNFNKNQEEISVKDNGENPESAYKEIEDKVKSITNEYLKFFIPKDISFEKISEMEDSEKRKYLVSMQVFLSYFNSDILRYEEQVIDRIKLLATPFEQELLSEIGLNVSDLIGFFYFIRNKFSQSMEKTERGVKRFTEQYDKMVAKLEKFEDPNVAYEYMMEQSKKFEANSIYPLLNLFMLEASDVKKRYGKEKSKRLLELFSLERRERDFIYYNSNNPFEERPLCWIDEERLFIVHPKIVLSAIYNKLIRTLEKMDSDGKIKFFEKRGEIVENLTVRLFQSIFKECANYYTSVCEIYGSEEHDLLIEYNDRLLIVEIKSSKVKEPLFNPDRAYKRIVDHFHSKSGIGGGYKQGQKLKELILSNNETTLYNKKTEPFVIQRDKYSKINVIVITLEQFGPLNINMSSLIELDYGVDYPWSCNLYDLESLIDVFQYLNKSTDDFISYIEWRIDNHNKISASDELDILEVFLRGEIPQQRGEHFFIPILDYSLIDKIYFEKRGIDYYHPNFKGKKEKVKVEKIGRNMLCPCGSGKKYKYCCLQ